jgi:hypothetical protein
MKMKYLPGSQSTIVCENRSVLVAFVGLFFAGIGIFFLLPHSGGEVNCFASIFVLIGLVAVFFGIDSTHLVIDTLKRTLTVVRKRWWWTYKTEETSLDGMSLRVASSYGRSGQTYRIEFFRPDKVVPVTTGYDNVNYQLPLSYSSPASPGRERGRRHRAGFPGYWTRPGRWRPQCWR